MIAEKREAAIELDGADFRRRLMEWYGVEARRLPWRGATDPYRIWVSEIMLQQTRVAAVIEHYNEFLRRFPTLVSLSLASDAEVLTAWSGLGYYRRARMLHKAAQFIVLERDGRLPGSSGELRTLPGIGEYTAAAIASIAFGEHVAVVDGNVERVILRLIGLAEEATAAGRAFVRAQAQALLPEVTVLPGAAGNNPAGDHNQAMMELGAMVCLPRGPQCDRCPVYELCGTRGEHATPVRAAQRSVPAACLLDLRKRGTVTEILLNLRAANAPVMPAMFELPALPLAAVEGREPVLRVRHSITNTNYYVQVFTPQRPQPEGTAKRGRAAVRALRGSIPKGASDLHWVNVQRLPGIPLTGLARKILQRLKVMEPVRINVLG
ncbi:MAG TPA: A/G-specific adenine glycosylase [Acidobacteriaceae bacterium]|nr:A/G-specific adenine glycosylase [Acidobacteriaceae bacterium]